MGGLFAHKHGCGRCSKRELILKMGCFIIGILLYLKYEIDLSQRNVLQLEDMFFFRGRILM